VRPDRLACRFDALTSDIPLLQAMKACVVFLGKHVRGTQTRRRLDELRFVLADIADMPPRDLRWDDIRIDRTNRRWADLVTLARLFLNREWQATHHDAARGGLSLLFPMNELFEAYVAALLRRALGGTGLAVRAQGGLRHCLGEEGPPARNLFQTRPDLIVSTGAQPLLVIDTKWKRLDARLDDAKQGVSQADVYQLMAYGQLYRCPDVMLLYPHHPALGPAPFRRAFTIHASGGRRLHFASLDVAQGEPAVIAALRDLCLATGGVPAAAA